MSAATQSNHNSQEKLQIYNNSSEAEESCLSLRVKSHRTDPPPGLPHVSTHQGLFTGLKGFVENVHM